MQRTFTTLNILEAKLESIPASATRPPAPTHSSLATTASASSPAPSAPPPAASPAAPPPPPPPGAPDAPPPGAPPVEHSPAPADVPAAPPPPPEPEVRSINYNDINGRCAASCAPLNPGGAVLMEAC